jgi:hypothetical protein
MNKGPKTQDPASCGPPFRAVAVIAADDVKISGTVTEFSKIAESGNERLQGFCGKCGSHLYATDPAKTLFMIRTGCLTSIMSLFLPNIFLENLRLNGLARLLIRHGLPKGQQAPP